MPILKAHDIVQLVTGGPDMAIEKLTEDGALCTWFDGPKNKERTFHPALLVKKAAPKLSDFELASRIAFIFARSDHSEGAPL